jgi:hypothetical protein
MTSSACLLCRVTALLRAKDAKRPMHIELHRPFCEPKADTTVCPQGSSF